MNQQFAFVQIIIINSSAVIKWLSSSIVRIRNNMIWQTVPERLAKRYSISLTLTLPEQVCAGGNDAHALQSNMSSWSTCHQWLFKAGTYTMQHQHRPPLLPDNGEITSCTFQNVDCLSQYCITVKIESLQYSLKAEYGKFGKQDRQVWGNSIKIQHRM